MFVSKAAAYNDALLLGTAMTTADANFDSAHPPDTGHELLIAFNTTVTPFTGHVEVDPASTGFVAASLDDCPAHPAAAGSLAIPLPPFDTLVCGATQ